MAKVSYVDIAPELTDSFWLGLQPGDRYVFSRVRKKTDLLSVKRKKGLTQRSLLPAVAALWQGLIDGERTAWSTAGAYSGLNGYRLFVKDTCARIVNAMSGTATPDNLHQAWVGQLHIADPASELKIAQFHPQFYYVLRKIGGKKGSFQPVKITEDFAFPLVLDINYKSNLTPYPAAFPFGFGEAVFGEAVFGDEIGGYFFANFYARIWSSYQGVDRYTDFEIPLDLVSDWTSGTITISSVIGHVIGYDLYVHLKDLRGDLFVDNMKATHSAQNWLRDPYCEDINQGFTRAFYQVPKHWIAITAPDGTYFESIYQDF